MASLFLTAQLLGRQGSAMTSLVFAAGIMIGITPQIMWTASFQMSFLAMTGLILITPSLMELGRKIVTDNLGEKGAPVSIAKFITDSFSVTLGAVLAVWPLIAYYFGIISIAGPLTTFLALPVLPGIIITGALASGIGLVALPIAQAISWLVWLFLSYMLLIINGFASLPISSIDVGSVNITLIGIF